MTGFPSMPNLPGGLRKQRAEQLKAKLNEGEQAAQQATGEVVGDAQKAGGPVGQGEYVVSQGECMSSIAVDTGHYWKKIWNHGPNAELQSVRKNPNVLLPGDQVTVPEKVSKEEAGAAEMRHRFVRRGEPAELNLTLLHEDKPITNAPYKLEIDGKPPKLGVTTADGSLHEHIPGNARGARLTVETESQIFKYRVQLGHLPPIDTREGVQRRLMNLGFLEGNEDDWGPRTESALKRFQSQNPGIEASGKADEATKAKLKEAHKS